MTGKDLAKDAQLAGWATPSAQGSNGEISPDLERVGQKWRNKKTGRVLQTNLATDAKMFFSGWATPRAEDSESSGMRHARGVADTLTAQAGQLAGWPTPMAGTPAQNGNNAAGNNDFSRKVVDSVSGMTPDGSTAETASTAGFQLNPRFSLWLMGFPTSWHDAGASALRCLREQATPLSRKSPPGSSKSSSKPVEK
jgi:hypothetical protein